MPYDLPKPSDDILAKLTEFDKIVIEQFRKQGLLVDQATYKGEMPTVVTFIKSFAEIIHDHWETLTTERANAAKLSPQKLQEIKHNTLIALLVSQAYLLESEVRSGIAFAKPFNNDEADVLRLTILNVLFPTASTSERRNFIVTQRFKDSEIKSYLKLFQQIFSSIAKKRILSEDQVVVFRALEERLVHHKLLTEHQDYTIAPVILATSQAVVAEIPEIIIRQPSSENISVSPPAAEVSTDKNPSNMDEETSAPVATMTELTVITAEANTDPGKKNTAEEAPVEKSTSSAPETLPLDYLLEQMTAFYPRYTTNRDILDNRRHGAFVRPKTKTSRPQEILSIIYVAQLADQQDKQSMQSSETFRDALLSLLIEPIIAIKAQYDAAWTPSFLSISTPTSSATYCSAAQILLEKTSNPQMLDQQSLNQIHAISVEKRIQWLMQLQALLELPSLDLNQIEMIPDFASHAPKAIIDQTLLQVKESILKLKAQLPAIAANEVDDQDKQAQCAV